jgi:hypothetical protein
VVRNEFRKALALCGEIWRAGWLTDVARPRPEKKRDRKDDGQLPLLTARAPAALSEMRVLPMQLQVGDRLVDETGEWEVAGRPYTSSAGKTASVRVRKVGQPGQPEVTEIRSWGACERVSVKRT